MAYLAGILAAVSIFLIFAGLLRPKPVARPQGGKKRKVGFFQAAGRDLASWFTGHGTDDVTWRGDLNKRYVERLQMANWYRAPDEQTVTASGDAPFYNLETMWAAKVLHGGLFALGGLLLVGAASVYLHFLFVVAVIVGLVAGLIGFTDPDRELSEAVEKRRRQMVIEMGHKVPEMRTYVRAGRTLPRVLRRMTDRPGGPFVQELYRVLEVYAATSNLERGLRMVMQRNRLCQPLVNLCGDLMAAIESGGNLGPLLDAHADAAQHEQRRMLRQQGEDNAQEMGLVVAGTTLLVMFMLIGAPALWTVMEALSGGM